jgi:hypothetical protein
MPCSSIRHVAGRLQIIRINLAPRLAPNVTPGIVSFTAGIMQLIVVVKVGSAVIIRLRASVVELVIEFAAPCLTAGMPVSFVLPLSDGLMQLVVFQESTR